MSRRGAVRQSGEQCRGETETLSCAYNANPSDHGHRCEHEKLSGESQAVPGVLRPSHLRLGPWMSKSVGPIHSGLRLAAFLRRRNAPRHQDRGTISRA